MDDVLRSSAVLKLFQSIKFDGRFLWLTVVDLVAGLILYTLVQEIDVLSWWEQFSGLISYIDEIISWLLRNPVGLKLNEPVNLALASFFRYHVYLWHTFVQFLNAPWVVNLVKFSLCLGLSTSLAFFTDLLSLFTLHIHCFDIYASRYVFWSFDKIT